MTAATVVPPPLPANTRTDTIRACGQIPTLSRPSNWLAITPATSVPCFARPLPPTSSVVPPNTLWRSTTAGAASVDRSTPVSTTQTFAGTGGGGAYARNSACASTAWGVGPSAADATCAPAAETTAVAPTAINQRARRTCDLSPSPSREPAWTRPC